MNKFKSKN